MDHLGQILLDELRKAKTPSDYSRAYLKYYQSAEKLSANYIRETGIKLACGSCSFCCYQWVRVLAHEIFVIIDYMKSMEYNKRDQTIKRLQVYHEKTKAIPDCEKDRQNIPLACPFLVDGRCSIYPVRPSNCRACHSSDSSYCERCINNPYDWQLIPIDQTLKRAWVKTIRNADRAYFLNQMDQTTYDLIPGCLAALSDASFYRRWTRKKKALLSFDSSP
jgi:Fe-S-cluster containining protein